jgi:internalin A
MGKPSEQENHEKPRKKPRRRWFQFGLSTLLAVTALAAGGAMAFRVYVEPYRRQRETMALIEKLGGSYQTTAADKWLLWLFGDDFQNITLVDLANCDEPEAYLDQIAALPAVEVLIVGGNEFSDEHLRRLHRLGALRGLVLDTTSVTNDGLCALRTFLPEFDVYRSQRRAIMALRPQGERAYSIVTEPTKSNPRLRQLVGVDYFDEAVEVQYLREDTGDNDMAYLRQLGSLRVLSLSDTAISDDGLGYLKELTSLESLELRRTRTSDAGLAHVGQVATLRELRLAQTQVTDDGLTHLQGLKNLEALELYGTTISDVGLTSIETLSSLTYLDLSSTGISNNGLMHLKRLSGLKRLLLEDTPISDVGLAQLRPLTNLEFLDLAGTRVTAAGLVALNDLSHLTELDLYRTHFSDAGLVQVSQLASLKCLFVDVSSVTEAEVKRLLPNCRIGHRWPNP